MTSMGFEPTTLYGVPCAQEIQPICLSFVCRFTKILHRLCQLDGESAYYAEKLLLYPSAGEYSGRIAGIIQVTTTIILVI